MADLPCDPGIPDLVSVTEMAEALHMTPQGVRKAAARGQILGAKVGGTWVFRRAILKAQLQRRGLPRLRLPRRNRAAFPIRRGRPLP